VPGLDVLQKMKEHAQTKQERMEMRKAIGNRVITPPKAPPFHRGPDYLSHYACFACCKSFKQDAMSSSHRHICPECLGDLHDMGRNFRPPRKAAKASWEVARRLYGAGFRFFGSGSHSDPALPTSLREVDQFIADNPNHYLRIR
jgi:predicted nucleic acid-binding Zn ribbon protein